MKALFLESKAADQCRAWAKRKHWDEVATEELLDRCYARNGESLARLGKNQDDWWVSRCLDADKHKLVSLITTFNWGRTAEGDPYWRGINNFRR